MRLFRMELYKLCHRKIVIVGACCLVTIMLLFGAMKVSEEWTYIDGTTYEGYEAIQKDREITEGFRGVLTDDKVDAIIEKYGFPKVVVDNSGSFRDSNYLNAFVTDYLSDGFMRGWREGEYQAATCTYPISETELGAVKELTGREIMLEYANGWSFFIDILDIGIILASILVLFSISVLFAGEKQAKMVPLLFTTREGRTKDIYIKITAAFLITVCIWLMVVFLDLMMCGLIYGFDGLDSLVGTSITWYIMARNWSVTIWTVRHYLMVILFRSFIGMMMLCATTVYISARCQSSFHAVSIAATTWGLPILLWFLLPDGFRLLRILIYASPLYHGMSSSIFDINGIWPVLAVVAVVWSVICIVRAYWKYKRQQAA